MRADIKLDTERLILRPYAEPDREEFIALNCDAQVREHMDGPLDPDSASSVFDRILEAGPTTRPFSWAIRDKARREYVGHAFVSRESQDADPELGFLFRSSVWGQGYGTEVAVSVVNFCVDVAGLTRLIATVDIDHRPSIRVLEKAGFLFERTVEDENEPYHLYALNRPHADRR